MQPDQYKLHPSSAGQIMAKAKGTITPKQLEKITELEAKEKLTEKQAETLEELKEKREKGNQLSTTAKTHCKEWVIEQKTGRKKEFTNKYVEKGILVEDESIRIAKDHFMRLGQGWGEWTFKNEKTYSNDYFIGTPDIILENEIIDIKSSWDVFTFPWFDKFLPTKGYNYQLQCYMDLLGKDKAKVVYVLSDAPQGMIERELYYRANQLNLDTIPPELIEEVERTMLFDDIQNRVKSFEVERDESIIKELKSQVLECRKYIKNIWDYVG